MWNVGYVFSEEQFWDEYAISYRSTESIFFYNNELHEPLQTIYSLKKKISLVILFFDTSYSWFWVTLVTFNLHKFGYSVLLNND